MTDMITQFIRDKKSRPVAVLVAQKDSQNRVHIAWAKCHKNDRCRKDVGKKIAIQRLNNGFINCRSCPDIVWQELDHFRHRLARYFRVPVENVSVLDNKVSVDYLPF